MVVSRLKICPNIKITVGDRELKQVENFTYLGSNISNDGKCEREIKIRIGKAKTAFNNLKELLKRDVNIQLKIRFLKCYVWSVLMYGSEAWTIGY